MKLSWIRQKDKTEKPAFADTEPAGTVKNSTALVIPRRRLLRVARRVARANRLKVILYSIAVFLIMLFLFSYCRERSGNFTISLNRLELFRKGICLSNTVDFKNPTSRLKSKQLIKATNISIDDLPGDLNEKDGENSGDNYVSYTYYIKNGGAVKTDYYVNILLEMTSKNAEKALRVIVYFNDNDKVIYAKARNDGTPEEGTVAWVDDKIIMENYIKTFDVGEVHKYTVILYIEGDDPDCTDDIVGGMVRCSMNFDSTGDYAVN